MLISINSTCIVSSVRLHVVVAQGSEDFMCPFPNPLHLMSLENAKHALGDGVPLGALSVFEPLGGILSANLPVIYLIFANAYRKLKSFSAGFSSRSKLAPASEGSSRFRIAENSDRSGEKWIELPRSNHSVESKASENSMYMTRSR